MTGKVLTLHHSVDVVGPITEARKVVFDQNPSAKLSLQEVAFVEEEDHRSLGEKLGRTNILPKKEGVFQAIDSGVL